MSATPVVQIISNKDAKYKLLSCEFQLIIYIHIYCYYSSLCGDPYNEKSAPRLLW